MGGEPGTGGALGCDGRMGARHDSGPRGMTASGSELLERAVGLPLS